MASTEFIRSRIEGTKAKLEKLNKKMERILKAEATDWEVNPYYYHEYDKRSTARDIEAETAKLAKYEADLATAIEKDNSRNVAIIVEFLNNWKARVTEHYNKTFAAYPEAREQYYNDMKAYDLTYFELRKLERENPEAYKTYKREKQAIEGQFKSRFGILEPYLGRNSEGFTLNTEKLEKDLTEEANRKYDFIIERTNAIVGEITDAAALHIGGKGDLNGYIIGTKATAKVQTIGAGGYNIQCYHFRTLINKMK